MAAYTLRRQRQRAPGVSLKICITDYDPLLPKHNYYLFNYELTLLLEGVMRLGMLTPISEFVSS
jgi:hypothetical protein